jgi:hypothetical protein
MFKAEDSENDAVVEYLDRAVVFLAAALGTPPPATIGEMAALIEMAAANIGANGKEKGKSK